MRDFAFARPSSLADATAAFSGGGEAAYIAGGHTLLPAIKSRLRMPDTLIDLSALPGMTGVNLDGDTLWVGAMTTHAAVASDTTVAASIPGLARLAALIGDPQVRNRGTLGGVIANNDPAADYPAALLAMRAVVETSNARHAADDYFQGMFATALNDGEIVLRVGFKVPLAAAYAKFRHPASRYAVVGVFVARYSDGVRVAITGAGPGVFRWAAAETALTANFSAAAVAGIALEAEDLNTDIHASAEFRAHLAGVMLAQAIAEA